MWYPFKFWRNVGYVYMCGALAELHGISEAHYSWRTRRAVRAAMKRDPNYRVAVPGEEWTPVGIEGWCTSSNGTLRALAAHFVNTAGIDLWVQTSVKSSSLRLFSTPHRDSDLLTGATTRMGDRIIDVAYRPDALTEPPRIVGFQQTSDMS